jgi:energy-coupling factor transport system substrate-specific component
MNLKFRINELLIIAILSAIGLCIKPIVSPLTHIISSPLMIPGGSISGGIYMSWLVLAKLIIPRTGSSLLVGVTQGILVIMLGFFGNHGIYSIVTYGLPGLAIELICLILKKRNILNSIIYCIAANLTGSALISVIIFRLPTVAMIIALSMSIISAIAGAFLAWSIYRELIKLKIIRENT